MQKFKVISETANIYLTLTCNSKFAILRIKTTSLSKHPFRIENKCMFAETYGNNCNIANIKIFFEINSMFAETCRYNLSIANIWLESLRALWSKDKTSVSLDRYPLHVKKKAQ